MTTISLADRDRDDSLEYALRRYREASAREVMAANHDRLMGIVKAVQSDLSRSIDQKVKT